MLPHDLLPIKRPLEDNTPIKSTQFYDNVVHQLISDIVKIEANGIPIDLNKVQELEKLLDNILAITEDKLANNPMVQKYLKNSYQYSREEQEKQIKSKLKSMGDFIKPFDRKNKIHRSYVINTLLKDIDREDLILPEWSIKDLKVLNQVISNKFLVDLESGNIQKYMESTIDKAMQKLARDKANIYNKSNINQKLEKLAEKGLPKFNPASSLQKIQFFNFCGINSEKETNGGNPQWDRKELERLQKELEIELNERIGEINKEK